MTTALTLTKPFSIAPQSFDEAVRFAELVAKSDLAPRDYKGKPGNVLVAVQMGAEVGLSPMQALQNIAVINGRPAVWGDAMLALCMAHSSFADIVETDDGETATCTTTRKGRSVVTRTFSMADAKLAGLAGKDGAWKTSPKRMRQMRARGFSLRDTFPDVLRGLCSAEESEDLPVRAEVVHVQPARMAVREELSDPINRQLQAEIEKPAAVIDEDADPEDFQITFGKNAGKTLRELNDQSVEWYAEKSATSNVKAHCRAALQARREKAVAKKAQEFEATTGNDGWGLMGSEAQEETVVP